MSDDMLGFVNDLQRGLVARSESRIKAWWERYLAGAIRFRGVKMADIRTSVAEAWEAYGGTDRSAAEGLALAVALLKRPLAEDKLSGVLLMAKHLLPTGRLEPEPTLAALAELFGHGAIADWNTCDWLCVKVLGPLVEREGEVVARALLTWRDAEPLWQRRAACVAFANLAGRGDALFAGFVDALLEACGRLAADPERFAQSGAGWVLRELKRAAPDRVAAFVEARRDALGRDFFQTFERR